ncbi:toll/interleukin-1 receptor domain-containing protein [Paenarthrobacter sp. FR1]|uniref:toll/interleukin-1 receptor domain-containing protein n=1 Tax=Paenarthrobacter sp. FR1 TaxID=3439548 RepID=UPI003DA5F91A
MNHIDISEISRKGQGREIEGSILWPSARQTLARVSRRPKRSMSAQDLPKAGWDVFISHASEDKSAVARPLHSSLTRRGAKVWLDEVQLGIGDGLRRSIDAGIAQSRFSVVVISPSFFTKSWTQHELDGILAKSIANEQQILPIWHDVSLAEVLKFSPSLADKVARSTNDRSINQIAAEIFEIVQKP